jgi:hypothetical protein|tara:strand:+ start:627 stop:1109 length:483 start_codon:yes stop_codon:yes gene_type:complete
MKLILLILILISPLCNAGDESIGNGFYGSYVQDDPFDTTKKRYTRVSKNGFDFNCKEISFRDRDGYYDEFSFSADIALKIDSNEPFRRLGTYSTGMFGQKWVTDSRFFSVPLFESRKLIQELKSGNTLIASGKWGTSGGWSDPKKLSLIGFTDAFNKLCN